MSERIVIGPPHDELSARIRALEAERLRPVPPPPKTRPRINLIDLTELVEVLGEDDEEEASAS